MFSKNKSFKKNTPITPEVARKLTEDAVIRDTSVQDCLDDIQLRAARGYSWTYMLKVNSDVIIDLKSMGWNIQKTSRYNNTDNYTIKIAW